MDPDTKKDVLRDWFVEGIHRGARFVVVIYDELECMERPIFVFPEQNIQMEVVKQVADHTVKMVTVMDLLQDRREQIEAANLPREMVNSRKVN